MFKKNYVCLRFVPEAAVFIPPLSTPYPAAWRQSLELFSFQRGQCSFGIFIFLLYSICPGFLPKPL